MGFAMRPFFGYNFGHYLQHWLNMESRTDKPMPKIFHVNWFRKDDKGNFMWPGFGENIRVLDWILQRLKDENVDMHQLFRLPKDFWLQEVRDSEKYLREQVGEDVPNEIWEELRKLEKRVEKS